VYQNCLGRCEGLGLGGKNTQSPGRGLCGQTGRGCETDFRPGTARGRRSHPARLTEEITMGRSLVPFVNRIPFWQVNSYIQEHRAITPTLHIIRQRPLYALTTVYPFHPSSAALVSFSYAVIPPGQFNCSIVFPGILAPMYQLFVSGKSVLSFSSLIFILY
jgi:hypothetical protein